MRYGDSLDSLSLESLHSGGGGGGGGGGISLLSLAHGRWRSRPGQATRPCVRSMRSLSMCPSSNYMAVYSSTV